MRVVLRQDPDVILVGEMRDQETVAAALSAAETGHLVFSTLHTINATETINRIVDFFPPHQQSQIRLSLAGSLQGIVCQRLIPTVGGRQPGARPSRCWSSTAASSRPSSTRCSPATSRRSSPTAPTTGWSPSTSPWPPCSPPGGSRLAEAMATASNPHDLKVMLERQGILQTGLVRRPARLTGTPATRRRPSLKVARPSVPIRATYGPTRP